MIYNTDLWNYREDKPYTDQINSDFDHLSQQWRRIKEEGFKLHDLETFMSRDYKNLPWFASAMMGVFIYLSNKLKYLEKANFGLKSQLKKNAKERKDYLSTKAENRRLRYILKDVSDYIEDSAYAESLESGAIRLDSWGVSEATRRLRAGLET